MIECTLRAAAASMQGRLHGQDTGFRGISTDTRSLRAGELFFALRGPNFDGAEFVSAAAEARAAGAVVEREIETDLASIVVRDSRIALGDLAGTWRRKMPATIVGITGSNGKTTLKELIASILGQSAPTLATAGNLNNDIGLPLMLARLEPGHRYAVFEMGANHAGEIAYLTRLAAPRVVAITNAGPAHLEGFGSIEGVARAKGEILQGQPRPDCAVLNADDAWFGLWMSMARDIPVRSFGFAAGADVRASDVRPTAAGSAFTLHMPGSAERVELPLAGRHNVVNACAAAAVAYALDIRPEQVVAGLQAARPVGGRLRRLAGIGGCTLYDDSYNANPASVIAAAEFLGSQPGENWLVLGDMAELGAAAAEMHADVGRRASGAGVSRLFATGPMSRHAVEAFGARGEWFETVEGLTEALRCAAGASPPAGVLVKGSRSSRMERVVAALAAEADGA
ncbi:MAG: UDP-N-acetylmuramoyl-tripeptide--D-alanyl-D-alanine ligase [Gammaproteobacteria bacterium]|nr:UDP-N-acetylmuramoyl-tripeptide--D-alanyl-D-alanine ligase [Gammaproteobacteria bacterium]MDH4253788.1 UDP-N-acetylmuramoyl-tripeptide--D-alanyl-D-alanine ligase [Gammaproteobacteria bacterium]MDH5308639.1 UDP-N-acetylmuramoyl-tripeptide--D-alanyl-D-alanine ligase [Gammaproteobacteria bacterium]